MKNKNLQTILYSTVGVIALFIIVLALNVIFSAAKKRIDLTQEKAYTLSPGTKAILGKLAQNRLGAGRKRVGFFLGQIDALFGRAENDVEGQHDYEQRNDAHR